MVNVLTRTATVFKSTEVASVFITVRLVNMRVLSTVLVVTSMAMVLALGMRPLPQAHLLACSSLQRRVSAKVSARIAIAPESRDPVMVFFTVRLGDAAGLAVVLRRASVASAADISLFEAAHGQGVGCSTSAFGGMRPLVSRKLLTRVAKRSDPVATLP